MKIKDILTRITIIVLSGAILSLVFAIVYFAYRTLMPKQTISKVHLKFDRLVHIYEFYDFSDKKSKSLEARMDKLATKFDAYSHRFKLDAKASSSSHLLKEFGIKKLPAVIVTNRSRDFRMIFDHADIAKKVNIALVGQLFGGNTAGGST